MFILGLFIVVCSLFTSNSLFGAYKPGELIIETDGPLESLGITAQSTYAGYSTSPTVDPIFKKYPLASMQVIQAPYISVKSGRTFTSSRCIYLLSFSDASANILEISKEFSTQKGILNAQPNYIYKAFYTPNDVGYPLQWSLASTNVTKAWDYCSGNASVKIAILDTGVSLDHPDLKNKIVNSYNGFDGSSNASDTYGHGTHVAGIAAAQTNNNIGVAGVAPLCSLMAIKAGDSAGNFYSTSIVSGINFAITHQASAINMSFGGVQQDTAIETSVETAIAQNIPVVAAAGNESHDLATYHIIPASYTNVIAVSAVTGNSVFDNSYSNYGSRIDVSAPGSRILSTYYETSKQSNTYAYEKGTSMAAPYVSGVVGLIKSLTPNITIANLYTVLTQTATDKGSSGKDIYYGWGIVNPLAAILALNTQAPTITHTPITQADFRTSISLSATITDGLSWASLPSANVYYRVYTGVNPITSWQSVKMRKNGTAYTATIPTPSISATQVKYYLAASDPKFYTLLPTSGSTSPYTITLNDLSGPDISSPYQDQDFLPSTSLTFTVTDNVLVSSNSLLVTVTSTSGSTLYKLNSSALSYTGSQLSLNISQLALPRAGNITVEIQAQDTVGNTSTKTVILKQAEGVLSLIGPTSSQVLNAPNPFNPRKESTYICYNISLSAQVQINVYSLNLQRVKTFTLQDDAGYHEVAWNGQDEGGSIVPNGVYIMVIKVTSNGQTVVKRSKIAVLR